MGFLSKLVQAAVSTALTPIPVVKDIVDVALGETPKNTEKHLENISEEIEESFEDLEDGEIL